MVASCWGKAGALELAGAAGRWTKIASALSLGGDGAGYVSGRARCTVRDLPRVYPATALELLGSGTESPCALAVSSQSAIARSMLS